MPRFYLIWFYTGDRLDSLVDVMRNMKSTTRYERAVFAEMDNAFKRRYEECLTHSLTMLEEYPQDFFFNMMAGHKAKSLFKPALALQVLYQLKNPQIKDVGMIWHHYKIWNVTESLMMLKKYEEAVQFLDSLPTELKSPVMPVLYIDNFVALGKSRDQIEDFIVKSAQTKVDLTDYYASAAYEYTLRSDDKEAR